MNIPRILSIAGSDSGGGAGIQADIKTATSLGCHAMTAITAITAQNTMGVNGIQSIDNSIISSQIDAVFSDIGVDAVKLGMLANAEIVENVAHSLKKWQPEFIVVDPVLRATSGAELGGDDVIVALKKFLFPIATLITPNLFEVSALLGRQVERPSDLVEAGAELLKMGSKAVLLKGGHLSESFKDLVDVLVYSENEQLVVHQFSHPRIETNNTHGTGCTLSTAIACYLAKNVQLQEAVRSGIDYVQSGLLQGKALSLGSGHGPLWHMHEHFKLIND